MCFYMGDIKNHYSIATADSAGPGYCLYVVSDLPQDDNWEAISGWLWGYLRLPWGHLGLFRGHLGTTLGGLGRYLGTPLGLGFRVWGLVTTTHTPLKCKNRSRLTLVQRKHSHENTMMLSSIEISYFMSMLKSFSPYACAAKSPFSASNPKP